MLCCGLHITGQGEAGKVDLVTADGSIDCQSDPARQESIVSDLHHCEAVAALRILAPGGSLVLKMFTLFESESVCLLYLLVSVFNEVDVFKPATSKEGNSEVYIVCRDLQSSNWLESVLAQVVQYFSTNPTEFLQLSGPHYGKFPVNNSLFDRAELPDSFMAEVVKCGELFMQLQENVINNNLHYWQVYKHIATYRVKLKSSRRDLELSGPAEWCRHEGPGRDTEAGIGATLHTLWSSPLYCAGS